jgi:signal recognition particle subunit SRP14
VYIDPKTNAPTAPPSDAQDPLADLKPSPPTSIIVRATNGKGKEKLPNKLKLSTVVHPDAIDGFYVRYADICKGGMQALKKRDRSKRKKTKKKKGGEGDKKT